ncbi:MAG TPA: V-type ATP synthase subunit D [Oscillospiraceae bacterium]|nr:V-type ATP synthase subunit D [Oscillospiraceae bacterium]HPS35552.1 V-type ATP synthase subunit D [Oscillospiraceae bacterium]
MPVTNVSPTRMELTLLKRRLTTAKRGHKLLKDKQDELVKKFIELVRQNRELRLEVEKELSAAFGNFVIASAVMSAAGLESALLFPMQSVSVEVSTRNVMSVNTPVFELKRENVETALPYGLAQTSAELDFALERLQAVFVKLIKLAEVEKSCQLMAKEIERTRRRVNALEYVMIPNFMSTIRAITMKLDEADRSTRVNLMKIKQMQGL